MTRMQKYVSAVAVAAALVGTPTVAYAGVQGQAASGTGTTATAARHATVRATVPTPEIVASGEHVTAAPGFELWLTPDGKHWVTPLSPEPEFRSVVDGNIDPTTPGVSLQAETTAGHAYLSGLYYGGKGTASRVVIRTRTGSVQGKLIELAGRPGWGVWYATADFGANGGDPDFITDVTVYNTRNRVYAQLAL